jgi:hypothetical protein
VLEHNPKTGSSTVIPDPKINRMSNEDATVRAAELAELILDEVSEADQNWLTIEWCAQALAELAAQVIQRATVPVDCTPDR